MMANSERGDTGSIEARFVEPAIAFVVFFASLAWFDRTLHLTLELRDEGFLLYNIARAASGEVPHRDFIEAYGPGLYALTGPVYHLFGERVMAIRELVAVLRGAAVTLAYLIARRLVPRRFALLGAGFALGFWGWSIWNLVTPYASLLTIPFCMLAVYLLLIGMSSGRRSMYFGAGFTCGIALLFKWSLAAVTAYGLVLAIVGTAMLESRTSGGPGERRGALLMAWALASALILLPFVSMLSGSDYLLHLAPIHLLSLSIGVAFYRYGDGRLAFGRALPLVVHVCVGFVIAPAIVALQYWAWGSLETLVHDVVVRPLSIRNYYVPVLMPTIANFACFAGGVLGVIAALALLGRRVRVALLCGASAVVLLGLGRYLLPPSADILHAFHSLTLNLPAIVAYGALAFVGAALLFRPEPMGAALGITSIVGVLFFQEMMSFQIFPRGGFNATHMLGTLAPLVAFLAYRGYGFAIGAGEASRSRKLAAFGLVALLPAIFLSRQIGYVLTAPGPDDLPHTALSAPVLAGIHPKPEVYERENLADFDALISALRSAEPERAPLFVIHNEPMIYYASGREPIFEDHMLVFFLAGWGLLPENDRDLPAPSQLIAELERHPETLVVTRLRDKSLPEYRTYFPELARYLRTRYRVSESFGEYRILRRSTAR